MYINVQAGGHQKCKPPPPKNVRPLGLPGAVLDLSLAPICEVRFWTRFWTDSGLNFGIVLGSRGRLGEPRWDQVRPHKDTRKLQLSEQVTC